MSKAKMDALLQEKKVITTVYISELVKLRADRYAANKLMKKGELQEKALIEYMQNHP